MMCAFVFVFRQIPLPPFFKGGTHFTWIGETYPPLKKGGRGDLRYSYPEWPKR